VFVFLHHPRWIGRGTRQQLPQVHEKLAAAGNVRGRSPPHPPQALRTVTKRDSSTTRSRRTARHCKPRFLSGLFASFEHGERSCMIALRSRLPIGGVMESENSSPPEFLRGKRSARESSWQNRHRLWCSMRRVVPCEVTMENQEPPAPL